MSALLLWLALGTIGEPAPARAQGECVKSDALKDAGKLLLSKGRWLPANAERLNKLLKTTGASSTGYDPCRRPLAVFDFDNTCILGDIGDETFASAVEDGFFAADERFFGLIPEAQRGPIKELWPTEPGQKTKPELRYLFHQAYQEMCKAEGNRVCFAWLVQLFAGKRPEEVETYAAQVIERALEGSVHQEQLSGPSGLLAIPRGAELRPEIKELIQAMLGNGFDVFIVTASAEWIVRAFAPRFGLPPQQVVGMRTVVGKDGLLTEQIAPPVIYREGKVAAIRTRIAPGGRVPVFAAGDTLTDWEMLDSARGEVLLFDREVPALKAHAAGLGWMIQPLFEKP